MLTILEMTATFGKLENETIRFREGLNIIEAPNEWGKSTWCAFLMAMLYGIDTRSRSTKTILGEKEHYSPWSGQPMSGSVLLDWDGRRIRITRSSPGRIPLGEFHAYEEETGLAVQELTPENCGKTLLGVEKEVFWRTNLLRGWELPVTDHILLRQRLQSLVATGEEGGDDLLRMLREQKNKLSYRSSGVLPKKRQALSEAQEAMDTYANNLQELENLQTEAEETEAELRALKNHRAVLLYQEARSRRLLAEQSLMEQDGKEQVYLQLHKACAALPGEKESEKQLARLQAMPRMSEETPPIWLLLLTAAVGCIGLVCGLLFSVYCFFALTVTAVGLWHFLSRRKKAEENRRENQNTQVQILELQRVLAQHRQLREAESAFFAQKRLTEALQAQLPPEPGLPGAPDDLDWDRGATEARITGLTAQQSRLLQAISRKEGKLQAAAVPSEAEVEALRKQVRELERMNSALNLAISTAEEARRELQARFAPGLTRRTAAHFSEMTKGKYNAVTIDEDLSLLTGQTKTSSLRTPLWCSSGTADCLYLALRIALSEEIAAGAPLIFDDAFVRLDDERLTAALEALKRQGENRQVLLFTCQSREKRLVEA